MDARMSIAHFDQIACVDFEVYWASDFTLSSKTISMTEYIRDERFEIHTCALQLDSWPEPKVAVGFDAVKELLESVDWLRTAFLAHHTQFDGLILTHHFGLEPVFWLDTMSISRAVYGADVSHSFVALSERLGLKGKVLGGALQNTKGLRLADMTPEQIELLKQYNYDDCHDTFIMFNTMKDYLPFEELRIIDATIRMYCEPLLLLDEQRLRELHEREVDRREKLVEDAETSANVLGSAPKFADLLRSLGVVPPMKISPRTGLATYAFAKTDLEFKDLLQHVDEAVRKTVEARLGNKGSIVESRSKRLIKRVGLPTPVYLAYAAARTLRWGGGDLSNWQNLPAEGDGANLRRALLAPEGTKLITSDASQVEARMTAWLAGFEDKLQAFEQYDAGTGPDLYCVAAEGICGRPIDAAIDTFERFMGKVLELSCQYGAGGARVQNSLRQGFRGAPPVDLPLHEVKGNVSRWRRANHPIVEYWHRIEDNAKRAWVQGIEVEDGPLIFERVGANGYIHMPNGTYIKYTNVAFDEAGRDLYYNSKNGPVKLWGGHLLENVSQALCTVLLKHHMIQIMDALPYNRIVLLVHDDIVSVADKDCAKEYAAQIKSIMSTTAPWAQGLPLNAKTAINDHYGKA